MSGTRRDPISGYIIYKTDKNCDELLIQTRNHQQSHSSNQRTSFENYQGSNFSTVRNVNYIVGKLTRKHDCNYNPRSFQGPKDISIPIPLPNETVTLAKL